MSKVSYADRELGQVVEYFDRMRREQDLRDLEARRQKGLNDVSIERTRAENEVAIERTKAEAGPELERLRQKTLIAQTTSKISAQDEENRLKAHEAELRKQEQQWEREAIERNSDLMEMRAQYEAAYKTRRQVEELELHQSRLEAEKTLAGMRAEVARATEVEAEAIRRQKQLDAELEIAQARQLATIRADELAQTAQHFGVLVEKIPMPIPDYTGIHTLILGSQDGKSSDLAPALLMDLLNRFVDALGSRDLGVVAPRKPTQKDSSHE